MTYACIRHLISELHLHLFIFQRRLLEQQQKQKRTNIGGGVRTNNPPRLGSAGDRGSSSALFTAGQQWNESGTSNGSGLYGYEGPMARYEDDPDKLDTGHTRPNVSPLVINVKANTANTARRRRCQQQFTNTFHFTDYYIYYCIITM